MPEPPEGAHAVEDDARPPDAGRLAGWWRRAAAAIVDLVIVATIWSAALIVFALVAESTNATTVARVLWLATALGLCAGYLALTMGRRGTHNGQTWGKQGVGIRVVRDNGVPMTAGFALVREVVLKGVAAVAGLVILADAVWPIWEREKRALHDLVARTHVISAKASHGEFSPQRWRPAPHVSRTPQSLGHSPHLSGAWRAEGRIRLAARAAGTSRDALIAGLDALMASLERSDARADLLAHAVERAPVERTEEEFTRAADGGDRVTLGVIERRLTTQRRMLRASQRFRSEGQRIGEVLDAIADDLVAQDVDPAVPAVSHVDGIRRLQDDLEQMASQITRAFA